ncbi:SGNH/GDSL hydrolase family protein [Acinetobacter baumannii]|uniref:SGNH/GDSL hydrolase family protein n=1 Tax=Acinetobacter baumannii TaxID=470 RepID=UPI0022357F23|nr:SGNH/GDSL hydrolase family protein [Acinetobacter baumannii]UZG63091.1 SGNH/GDSL hydrolase family protein [Acinetobacter baumannii]
MAIITEEKMQNLDRDIEDIGKAGNIIGVITPRYGDPYNSVPLAVKNIENKGGLISAPTLSALQAITPTYNHQVGRDDSTGNEYRWNPAALPTPQWEPTGRNFIQDAINFANGNKFFKPRVVTESFDWNNHREPGFDYFISGTTWDGCLNRPPINNQWAYAIIMPISEAVCGQFVWCFNAQKLAYRFSNASSVWPPEWTIFSGDVALTSIIKAAVNVDRDATFDARAVNSITPIFESLSKNFFDKNTPLLVNYRITAAGVLEYHQNSITTPLINVAGMTSIAVSGLQASTQAYRAYRFLDKDKKWISNAPIDPNQTNKVITVPSNAAWFQITLKDGIDTWALNTSTIQFESGTAVTSYTAYVRGKLKNIYGADFYVDPVQVYTTIDPVFESLSKNIFDKNSPLLTNYRITAAGVLEYHLNSVTTQPIYIKGLTSLTVSGLTASSVAYRAYRFLDKDKKWISNAPVLLNATSVTANNIPANAVYFQICLKDGIDTWALNLDTIQIESGTVATSYTAYVKGKLKALFGTELAGSGSGSGGIVSKAFNCSYLGFGDSIHQTSRVDLGIFNQLDNPFPNFPTYLYEILKISEFNNYSYSGASFYEYGQDPWRKMSYQVNQAIANGVNPSLIMVAMGTNDVSGTLGDYETAMSKQTLDDLDRTKTLEAARWAFWTIKKNFPNAVCFYANPLQRASIESSAFAPIVDGLSKMALRYGFTLIDQHHESGIIRDLELGNQHLYLADGLHPNNAGRLLQAQYIASKVIARMTY